MRFSLISRYSLGLIFIFSILVSACGSYQNSSYYSDGIYTNDNIIVVKRKNAKAKKNAYSQYFDEKIPDDFYKRLEDDYQKSIIVLNENKFLVNKVLADGNIRLKTELPLINLIKGDSNYVSIASASIIAKVTRDIIMIKFSKVYSKYNLHKNMGYGTKDHLLALSKYGITNIHRKSFKIKNI